MPGDQRRFLPIRRDALNELVEILSDIWNFIYKMYIQQSQDDYPKHWIFSEF